MTKNFLATQRNLCSPPVFKEVLALSILPIFRIASSRFLVTLLRQEAASYRKK